MKEKIKTFFCGCLLLVALPYIITLLFQGKDAQQKTDDVLLKNETDTDSGKQADFDAEEYLIGVVAEEIPISCEDEALKAQAVAARTNLMDSLEQDQELPDSMSQEELLSLWGQKGFDNNYERLTRAVRETKGEVMTYQGKRIYAAYHAVSAGSTRDGTSFGYNNMPWLAPADSAVDISSPDFLRVIFLEPKDAAERLKTAFPDVQPPEEGLSSYIVITNRDEAEYVTEAKLGEKTVTGEQLREALGLNSACFYTADVEGKLRIVTKGLGHGLGLSQYGADKMARDGKKYKEILNYYYKNIEISD